MPALITLFNNKGGLGKSTLSVMLTHAYAKTAKVGIIDVDPQRSLTNIAKLIPSYNLPLVECSIKDISDLEHKIIIADMPPQIVADTLEVLQMSNIIIMPCKPSIFDAVSTIKTFRYIQANTDTKAVVVLNMVQSNTNAIAETKKMLMEHDIPILKTVIKNRIVYSDSISQSINIYKAKNRQAINELNQLANEILQNLI